MARSRRLEVPRLARVEGEGRLLLRIRNGRAEVARMQIYEPPRFFEALLQGRHFSEVPDIVARICGICPVAYQMSASQALEDALGFTPDSRLRRLRRLFYCGEWIQSHALHVHLLHAPDFLGYDSAFQMAKDHPGVVERGLRLKRIGDDVLARIGGRAIHPVTARVGGFHHVPTRRDLEPVADQLRWALEAALALVRWTATLPVPEFGRDYRFVALRHSEQYPILEGRLVSSTGLDLSVQEFEQRFLEDQVPESTALHCRLEPGEPYLVGPLARFNLNPETQSPLVRELAREVGVSVPCRNPFRSITIRSLEIVQACDDALRIIDHYEPPEPALDDLPGRAGTGYGCTEAPRGILYHRYHIDEAGLVKEARIVPPTSQNLATIERDLATYAEAHLDLPDDKLTWQCEQAIRNYDPCISCATHAIRVELDRG